jgi:energy-coupling factor transport system ATP-binding protein
MTIELKDVGFRYPSGSGSAVEGVSLRVEAGEVVAIVGPNGSGKSTLGRLMKGLLAPTSGQITVDGLDTRSAELEVRRTVGLVFQNPNSQIVNAVVEGEVAFGPENLGLPPAEIRERVDDALGAVGLEDKRELGCHTLTMADKQRVALASVIAMRPRYLILDEPTAWVEPRARRPLLDVVRSWAARSGAGLIVITHHMDEAQLGSRVYGMLHGKLVVTGTPDEVLRNAETRAALSLDVPEALELALQLQDAGLPVEAGMSVPELAEALWRS